MRFLFNGRLCRIEDSVRTWAGAGRTKRSFLTYIILFEDDQTREKIVASAFNTRAKEVQE